MAQSVAPPPVDPHIVDEKGNLIPAWVQHFTQNFTAVRSPANTPVPASSAAPGVGGQIAYDQNFIYVYHGSLKKWLRSPLSSF